MFGYNKGDCPIDDNFREMILRQASQRLDASIGISLRARVHAGVPTFSYVEVDVLQDDEKMMSVNFSTRDPWLALDELRRCLITEGYKVVQTSV